MPAASTIRSRQKQVFDLAEITLWFHVMRMCLTITRRLFDRCPAQSRTPRLFNSIRQFTTPGGGNLRPRCAGVCSINAKLPRRTVSVPATTDLESATKSPGNSGRSFAVGFRGQSESKASPVELTGFHFAASKQPERRPVVQVRGIQAEVL